MRKKSYKIKKKSSTGKEKKVFSNHFIHYLKKKLLNLLVVYNLSHYRIFGPLEDFCHGY